MESLEASWSSFNATIPVESSEMMGHLHGAYPFPSECGGDSSLGISSMFQSNYDLDSYYYSSHNDHPSLYHWPQGNCSSSGSSWTSLFGPCSNYESYHFSASNVVPATNNSCIPIDVCTAEEEVDPSSLQNAVSHQFEDPICFSEETSSDSPGFISLYKAEVGMLAIHENEMSTESPKKKARASMQIQRNSKNVQPKNTQKIAKTANKEDSRASSYGQSSSCHSSEDDSNASQELNGGASSTSKVSPALNLDGKKRASRGSATDPQSLYARKRRERINERLRILQNLVPNGTKVDISTMLEEAVQYVKFLQLQIKLLSSEDLWMYAPIAYNGMNIGLDLKISPLQR